MFTKISFCIIYLHYTIETYLRKHDSIFFYCNSCFKKLCWDFFQYEAKMKSLQETMKDVDTKKRTLEESVDALNEECAKLKAAGKNMSLFHEPFQLFKS